MNSAPRVLCLGMAVRDLIFRVDTMPARAEKYLAHAFIATGGGMAANAAVAAARLGARVSLCGLVGDDDVGRAVQASLEREGIDCARLLARAGARTPLSAIFVDQAGERMVCAFRGDDSLWEVDVPAFDDVAEFDVVLADVSWREAARQLFLQARAAGVASVLDADIGDRDALNELLALADYPVMSQQGLRALCGDEDPAIATRALAHTHARTVIVTQGERGVMWSDGVRMDHQAAFTVNAVDTLAAGDVFHGAYAVALARGDALEERIHFAQAAAALKCARFGGQQGAPTLEEVTQFVSARRTEHTLATTASRSREGRA